MLTTCEYREEFGCLEKTSCGCIEGRCGWAQTPEYEECLQQAIQKEINNSNWIASASPHNDTIRVAHSPDSDDAFMFYAIKFGKIDLRGFKFAITSDEIQILNQIALDSMVRSSKLEARSPDIIAVSFHAYHYIKDKFKILRAGASMAGKDYGPRLVSKETNLLEARSSKLEGLRIAIPGEYTSAFLVLQAWLKETLELRTSSFELSKIEYQFCSYNEVFPLLESNQVDASLLIHESQLKYQEHDYKLIVDLGKWWYEKYQLQMPLGCNVINRDLGEKVIAQIDSIVQESIKWGLNHFEEVLEYSRKFAQNDLDDEAAKKYIEMYVNQSTVALTEDDLRSIDILLSYKN
jgi:1,4-dihydroxy-6-naphthoate synthase